MSAHSEIERRYAPMALRMDAESNRIRGHAIVFSSRSVNLGGFTEIIRPEAVDRTLREALDVRALVDHDSAKILGRKSAGTLILRKDNRGLAVDIMPPDTTAGRDIVESIRRGDVTGMSFSFRTLQDDWKQDEEGQPLREVVDMTISEVSVVTFPAYTATDVQMAQRSMNQFIATGRSITFMEQLHKTKLAMIFPRGVNHYEG